MDSQSAPKRDHHFPRGSLFPSLTLFESSIIAKNLNAF